MAEAINNRASLAITAQALVDLQGIDGAVTQQLTYSGFNLARFDLLPASTIPVDRPSYKTYTIGGGGTVDIDLTALAGSQDAIDATGKKVQLAFFVSREGNAVVTVGPGASNGYALFGAGNEVDFYSHADRPGVLLVFQPEGLPDVSGSAKIITLTGTAGQEVDGVIWVG